MTASETPHTAHHGRNVKRFREWRKLKQEDLAHMLGNDWSQKKLSRLEEQELIDDDVLQQIGKALNFPMEAIKNYDEEKMIMNVQNNYDGSNQGASGVQIGSYSTNHINPLERWLEALDKNDKLHLEVKELYAALLKEKEEKIALLQKMLDLSQKMLDQK